MKLLLFAVLVAFMGYRIAPVIRRMVQIVRPTTIPDSNIDAASAIRGVVANCSDIAIEESTSVYNVHDFETAAAIAAKLNKPVVFRNYLENHAEIWKEISHQYKDVILKQVKVESKSFGNLFMSGLRSFIDDVIEVSIQDMLKFDPTQSYYASFASFLSKASMTKLFGAVPKKYRLDTNFISNFPHDIQATPLHSTTYLTSYSLQMVGHKMWVWISPQEMEDIGVISSHTANFHLQGSEATYLNKTKKITLTVAKEGDFLIFPPLWGHSVITQAGPNVMFNMREESVKRAFFSMPFRVIENLWSTLTLDSKPHDRGKLNAVQEELWRHREKYFSQPGWAPPECGCKAELQKLLNAK